MNPFYHSILADVEYQKKVFWEVGDLTISGTYGVHVTPKSTWYNGATYITGYRDESSNYSPAIIKYKDGIVQYAEFGVVDNFDSLGHPHPAVLIIGGFIYVFHVNGHGQPIKIWKSNVAESIKDGFTLHHTINYNFTYCNPRMLSDGRVVITAREPHPDYFQICAISGFDDLTTWTIKALTVSDFATNNIRHYSIGINHYGNNQWNYIGIMMREDTSPETYFGHAIYKTQDYITFYSIDETFSKNIDVDGAFTRSEIEDHLMVVGSNTAVRTYTGPPSFIVVDDVIYDSYHNGTEWKFLKIDANGTQTEYPVNISGLETAETDLSHPFFLYYNGVNLIVITHGAEGVNRRLYSCDMDFGNIEKEVDLHIEGETDPMLRPVMPHNLDEVTGEYIIGGTTDQSPNIFPYISTDNKFFT